MLSTCDRMFMHVALVLRQAKSPQLKNYYGHLAGPSFLYDQSTSPGCDIS